MSLIIHKNYGQVNHIEKSMVNINPNGTMAAIPSQEGKAEEISPVDEYINQDEELFEPEEESRRGPKVTSLFISDEVEKQETKRLLSFLHKHKLGKSDLDAAQDNSANQVIVCFYRVWKEKNMLAPRAGATALGRLIKNIEGLSITVTEIAYSNALGRMIKPENKYPDWSGQVREYFQMN